MAKLMVRPNLGHHQGNCHPTMDPKLHHTPDALGDVKETFLPASTLGTHVVGNNNRGLAERVQLHL